MCVKIWLRNLRGIENKSEFGVEGPVLWNCIRIRKSRIKEWVGHIERKVGNINTQRVLDFKT
jgi:hypothetical protein